MPNQTLVADNILQLGEPRGAPWHRRHPTLPPPDPRLPRTSRSRRRCRAASVVTEVSDSGFRRGTSTCGNPLDDRVLLYDGEELVGAKQNRILNVTVLVEARSKLQNTGFLRRAGALVTRLAALRAGAARVKPASFAAEVAGTLRRTAEPRQGAKRGLGRRGRQGGPDARRLTDRCQRGRLRSRAPDLRRSSRSSRSSPARPVPSSRSETLCASTGSPDPRHSNGCGRSSGPATSSTPSSASTARSRRESG